MTVLKSDFSKDLMLTPQQIKRKFGVPERMLKTMRQNPKANNGDVPKFIIICNRPLYPAADFDIWFQNQIKKQKNKEANTASSATSAIQDKKDRTAK